ncbi:hypothetical protein RRG08_010976 [Elysia crispata]|uniref:Uncharacterized protein n=1 Tax=Elysia crispata TaxID=231223 RepID=A0AAE1CN58_9GAST|nr:hypothetical protein RRG08_010976 [Elysia crispata]
MYVDVISPRGWVAVAGDDAAACGLWPRGQVYHCVDWISRLSDLPHRQNLVYPSQASGTWVAAALGVHSGLGWVHCLTLSVSLSLTTEPVLGAYPQVWYTHSLTHSLQRGSRFLQTLVFPGSDLYSRLVVN